MFCRFSGELQHIEKLSFHLKAMYSDNRSAFMNATIIEKLAKKVCTTPCAMQVALVGESANIRKTKALAAIHSSILLGHF